MKNSVKKLDQEERNYYNDQLKIDFIPNNWKQVKQKPVLKNLIKCNMNLVIFIYLYKQKFINSWNNSCIIPIVIKTNKSEFHSCT